MASAPRRPTSGSVTTAMGMAASMSWKRSLAFTNQALGFRRFPLHAELGQCPARGADESAGAVADRFAGDLRRDGPTIDAVAEPDQFALSGQPAQCAQHLLLAAEIAKLTRQEHVVPLSGDPLFDLFLQCRRASHSRRPDLLTQKPDIYQG